METPNLTSSNVNSSPTPVVLPSEGSVTPAPGVEPIPGYILREKIGAGGYGEVWSADAPGGLVKAIKFVFGSLDDARAVRELRSLNRVKEVHHPFLLSLERIEVASGQLIILTELAESCLRKQFDAYREQGLPGIPRDELLDHLRDTADALDFLFEKHSLQHLDVKPENLLLVGNRVKVADFGLLKDLQDTSASLMGGMTPLYSPPEVFDGRPNQYSDQYSLAIVYQELLTGEPPFSGRTTAQLAAQHVSSPPMLSPVPLAEQPVIARALAKDSRKRFPSCRALVEALRNPKNATTGRRKELSVKAKPVESQDVSQTEVLGGDSASSSVDHTQTLATGPAEVKALAPLVLTESDLQYRPTIFVGVGGTAGKILSKLRHRLCDRFGNISDVPAFQMLQIDSDVKSLHRLAAGDDGSEIPTRDTISTPLRQVQEYRDDKENLQSWLSRRWLYNIPRSLQTEGMRPLGRLAVVDHFHTIQQRLHRTIEDAMNQQGLEISARRTGLEFNGDAPRIYVISSINGGFGSGSVVDIAYWIRSLLAERDISDDFLTGILTHSTTRRTDERDLAIANAVSFLDELQHFSSYGQGYPADEPRGIAAFDDDVATFRDAYVIHLGNELTDDSFDESLTDVAEYMFRNTATSAAAFFDKARADEHESLHNPLAERKVRSFGVHQLGAMQSNVPKSAVDKLCHAVVNTWCGVGQPKSDKKTTVSPTLTGRNSSEERVERAKKCAGLELKVNVMAGKANEVVQHFCGSTLNDLLKEAALDAIDQLVLSESARDVDNKVFDRLDRLISGMRRPGENGTARYLQAELEDEIKDVIGKTAESARENIFGLIDTPNERVPGAQRAARWFEEQIELLDKDNELVRTRLLQELGLFQQRFRTQLSVMDVPAVRQAVQSQSLVIGQLDFMEYAKLRHTVTIHDQLRGGIAQLKLDAHQISQDLVERGVQLRDFASNFKDEHVTESRSVVEEVLHHEFADLVTDLENELASTFFRANRMLSHVLSEGDSGVGDLAISMRTAARKAILSRASKAASKDMVNQAASELAIRDGLNEAMPVFADCGASYRLLVTAGNSEILDEIQQGILRASNAVPTILPESDGDVLLCYELEQISMEAIVRGLTGLRHDFGELALRLHTRKDIEWTTMCNGFGYSR